jgi:uncharacterized glyoxalase superfamily protein PhnB
MNTTQTTFLQSIYPAVRYADAKAAIRWLGTALGFQEHEVCLGDDDSVKHAELSINGNLIMLGSGAGDSLYIALNSAAEVDAAYARAKAAGATIVREPYDTDYNSREFSVRDPEGRGWSFGTYRPQAQQAPNG